MTSQEKINEFVNESPVNMAFVLTAIDRLANAVLYNKADVRRNMKNSIIHPDAWIAAAQKWKS